MMMHSHPMPVTGVGILELLQESPIDEEAFEVN